jgi:major vault protein
MCSLMAAKIRSEVAQQTFEVFHKGFAKIIRASMFGTNENDKIRDEYIIETNNMIVTNVDIQNVVPVDKKTREALKGTVSLAIEITTKRQKEEAKMEMDKRNQESEATINNLIIHHQLEAERANVDF